MDRSEEMVVLFVEDDAAVARAIARVLKGFRVRMAHTFQGAVDQMLVDTNAVITDFRLGTERNGYDVLVEAQKRLPDVPRILMTGQSVNEAQVAQAFSSGLADRVLLKPFNAESLVATLRDVLAAG